MKKLKYEVRFVTPAFLGNATQAAQWRTPPFKALLRQWWRVAYAADHGFSVDVAAMRREEGLLFGHARLDDDCDERGKKVSVRKSLVRIRLDIEGDYSDEVWARGTQRGVAPLRTDISTSYAWFGLARRGAGQPDRTGIRSGKEEGERVLLISLPDQYVSRIENIMRLIDALGQLGSRSRGGWGSFQLVDIHRLTAPEMTRYAQPIQKCLVQEWPMSLGTDLKGLCLWESRSTFPTWDRAMRILATERRNIRTSLKAINGLDLRRALGFAGEGRLASPLRWKVYERETNELAIRAFAMPNRLPANNDKSLSGDKLLQAWTKVCEALDSSNLFQPRTYGACSMHAQGRGSK
ncbi:MAG: hypothetical protein K8I29_07585 [Alphaproteobacteria bacterium]|uniref:CRISPR-associated protein Cmr1 n=1 Tax=Candidatus Nitrobium versatile TaxID=2884831 RepID=A0A953M1Q9_9BACT|nr:hypothetical protein [Candidatus Nitrobium versatile]